jgi:glutamyl-tRNA synthetase
MALIPSKRRDESIENNLERFEAMLKGTEEGQKWFLRAKIDHTSPNGAMRDPAVYRCVLKPHHITGDKFKAYPMYDMACPIVDSLDGVTHALRANEYADRKPQYEWFLKALGLKHIEIFDFSCVHPTIPRSFSAGHRADEADQSVVVIVESISCIPFFPRGN